MNKFGRLLINSQPARKTLQITAFILALVSYNLPLVFSVGAGLTFGGYDLAEWSSLHPIVRTSQPFMLTALLLRLPVVGLAWILAGMPFIPRWARTFAIIGIGIALLPPLEFFTQYRDDPNYQQQMVLALLAVSALFPVWRIANASRTGHLIGWLVPLITLISLIIGCQQAHSYMQAFRLPVSIGGSVVLFTLSIATLGALNIIRRGN
jgi:hypothetical protein